MEMLSGVIVCLVGVFYSGSANFLGVRWGWEGGYGMWNGYGNGLWYLGYYGRVSRAGSTTLKWTVVGVMSLSLAPT